MKSASTKQLKRTSINWSPEEESLIKRRAEAARLSVSKYLILAGTGQLDAFTESASRVPTTPERFKTVRDLRVHLSSAEPRKLDLGIDAPKELQNAIYDFGVANTRQDDFHSDFSNAVEQTEYVRVTLTEEKAYSPQLAEQLGSGLSELINFGQPRNLSSPEEGASDVRHLVRPGLVSGKRVMYLYPFYLPLLRRTLWGVIPYGHHRRIGFATKANTPMANALKEMPEDAAKLSDAAYQSAVQTKLGQLFSLIGDNGGNVHFREGWLAETVAETLWAWAAINAKSMDGFELHRKPYQDTAHVTSKRTKEVKDGDLLIFELFDSEQASKSFYVRKVEHFLDIPVGIGFTLSNLPYLLFDRNWNRLRQHSLQLFDNSPELLKQMREGGIEMHTLETNRKVE